MNGETQKAQVSIGDLGFFGEKKGSNSGELRRFSSFWSGAVEEGVVRRRTEKFPGNSDVDGAFLVEPLRLPGDCAERNGEARRPVAAKR